MHHLTYYALLYYTLVTNKSAALLYTLPPPLTPPLPRSQLPTKLLTNAHPFSSGQSA